MNLNLLTLRFSGDLAHLEPLFRSANARVSLPHNRAALIVGILFYSAFGVLDALIMPGKQAPIWWIRFGLGVPFLVGIFLVSLSKPFERWVNPLMTFTSIVAGLTIIAMILVAPPPVNYAYYAGILLVFMWTYALVRIPFLWAAFAGWVQVVLYEIVAIWIRPTPFDILVSNNFFFISTNIMGMIASYSIEYYIRRDFYHTGQIATERERTSQVNRELEHKAADYQTANRALQGEIAERQRVEEALRKSQELYARLVDTISDVFVHTDIDGRILFVNNYTVQVSGYSREELLGQNILTFVAPEDRDQASNNAARMLGDRLGPREYCLISKDQKKMHFDVNGEVLLNEDGTPFGRVYVCRDITDRRRSEEELRLLERMRGVLEMAGAISHEMNQPMQIISGLSQLLSMDKSVTGPIREDIQTIGTQINRMAAITKRLMSIKQYETQDYAGVRRIVDISRSTSR